MGSWGECLKSLRWRSDEFIPGPDAYWDERCRRPSKDCSDGKHE
jgi:hypothetical protein